MEWINKILKVFKKKKSNIGKPNIDITSRQDQDKEDLIIVKETVYDDN